MKLLIYHFQPLEKCPPVMNDINDFLENEDGLKLTVVSSVGSNSLNSSKLTDFYLRDTQAAILLEAMKTLKVTFNTNVLSK